MKLKFSLLFFCLMHILNLASSRLNSPSRVPDNGIPSHGRCEPIRVAFCNDIQYNETIMPNILGHTKQEDAASEVIEYSALVKSNCSPFLKFFLCSVYVPVCTVIDYALPPCRSLCLQAKRNCDVIMNSHGFLWPETLDCKKFPEGDLCVGQNQTSKQLRGKRALSCPAFMRTNSKYEYSLAIGHEAIKNCGMPCNAEGDLFGASESSRKVVKLVICIFAGVCFLSSFFTFLTFLIDTQRFRYPERPIIFISVCYCVISVAYIVGFMVGEKASCTEFEDEFLNDDYTIVSNVVTQGTKKEVCTLLFVMLYFCGLASCIWWVVLTLTWFLSAGLKWGQEAVEGRAQYFHLVAWAVPGVMTIVLLGMGHVDGDLLTGVCHTGLTNATTAKAFVAAPLIALLAIGSVFLVAGFVSLCRVRRAMKHDGSRTDKLEKLMMRIGVFALLYVAPVAVVIGCVFYEHAMLPAWTRGWYHRMCSNLASLNHGDHESLLGVLSSTGGHFQQWDCGDYSRQFANDALLKPDLAVFTIKHLLTLVVGVACGFWVVSGKTAQSWSRFFCRFSSHNNAPHNQPLKPTLL